MKSRAYRAVDVNRVEPESWWREREQAVVHAGLDIGKETIRCTLRWGADDFDRPWHVRNPFDVARLVECLRQVSCGRRLVVALEPTGTYGDALRQALVKADLEVHRVSPKQASDYAEVFDGVPSQHDGKDAAIIAELAAQGRSWPWPMKTPSEMEQELAYQVEWMDGQRRTDDAMVWPSGSVAKSALAGSDAACPINIGHATPLLGGAWRPARPGGRSRCAERACADGHVSICRRKKRKRSWTAPANGRGVDGSLGRRAAAALRAADTALPRRDSGGAKTFACVNARACGDWRHG